MFKIGDKVTATKNNLNDTRFEGRTGTLDRVSIGKFKYRVDFGDGFLIWCDVVQTKLMRLLSEVE